MGVQVPPRTRSCQPLVDRADKGGLGQVDVLGVVGQGRSARNDASRCTAIVGACLACGSFHTSQAEGASDPAAEEVWLLGRPRSAFQLLWARGATEATQQLNVDEVVHRDDGGMCGFSGTYDLVGVGPTKRMMCPAPTSSGSISLSCLVQRPKTA